MGGVTRLGFLLDSDSCIGCHACTVACKSEHDVPLGVNRTWVKYIETGTFPDVARKFSVMRCNQCDDAPCMAICPTSALYRADNGVVDFQDLLSNQPTAVETRQYNDRSSNPMKLSSILENSLFLDIKK